MTAEALKPSVEELKNFLGASLVTGAAYASFVGIGNVISGLTFFGAAIIVLLTREIGQRSIGYLMDVDVELDLSVKGSMVTVLGAFISVATILPLIFLFPVENRYSLKRYEHWGKSVDAIWLKREFWLASGGIVMLLTGWMLTYLAGYQRLAALFSLFTVFQMMPFDYPSIPTGRLDGSIILKQSGFMWLVFFGMAWTSLGLVWV